MGYDIHVYLEVKNDDNVWQAFGKANTAIDDKYRTIVVYDDYDVCRNYDIFGVLNGIHVTDEQKTKGTFPVMFSSPRGFPSDLSKGLQDTFAYSNFTLNRYGSVHKSNLKDYIPSYATYTELNDFAMKFKNTVNKRYDVDVPHAIELFLKQISENNSIKWGIQFMGNENHKNKYDIMIDEIFWNDIPDDRKRIVWYYDW